MSQAQEVSIATWTGNGGFPGIAYVMMVDEINGYVLAKLKPWTTYMPGIDDFITKSLDQTFTTVAFREVESKMSITKASILRGTYNATSGIWTYPVLTEGYRYT